MAEISITAEQQSEIEAVRDDLEAAFIDDYGHVRVTDAIDYLLDTYTPPDERERGPEAPAYERIATAEFPELQQVAADVDDVPGSGIDADEMRGKLLSTLGGQALAERLAEVDADADSDSDGDADEGADETGEPGETLPGTGDGPAADEGGAADDESGTAGSGPPTNTGGILSAANRLLDEHADKWRETESGDEPYEVDLPDGTVESARTKDDVRQVLFRHY